MTDISEMVGGRASDLARPATCRGRVVLAPATASDAMTVRLVNYSARFTYDVPAGQWVAQATLPAVDAECLVVFDDDGDVWVPAYTGGA